MRARPVGIGRERAGGHCGAKVRPADADIDDVAHLSAGHGIGAIAYRPGEAAHACEHLANARHHVLAIDQHLFI